MFHPTSRSVTVRPEDVEVTAVSADAARRQVDCALPTDSDRVYVVVEGLRQDSWSRMRSDVPGQGKDVVGVDCVFNLAGGPATALLTGAAPPAVFADEVTTRVTSLAVAGVVAADVATLANAGMVTVCVADLADAGMAFPANLAGVVAADVTALADAGWSP